MLSRPDQHAACAQLVQCLQSGSFRTQSAVLEFLASSIGRPLSAGDGEGQGPGDQLQPEIPEALSLLVADEGMPVLSAALSLCREQPDAADGKSASTAGNAWRDGGLGEWVKGTAQSDLSSPSRAAWGEEPREDANAYVQQKCCDDPADCEEPAVRERALRLLSCLAWRASSPHPSGPAVPAGCPEREGGTGGEEGRTFSKASGVVHKLWHLCTSEALVKDVLSGFSVSSALVTAAAG